LVVTSNLVEGSLIPTLAGAAAREGQDSTRVVDLFEIAKPTGAILRSKQEYADVRKRMYGAAANSSG